MHPIICKIGPFTIYSYGLAIVIAFLVGVSLAKVQAKKQGTDPQLIFNLCFTVFFAGIIGSRLFYVIENLRYYLKNPLEIFMLQYGGLSWFGGLLVAIIAAWYYLNRHRLPIYKTLDLLAPFVALGQAIGRIGCFLNGCCFGKGSIPIQLYSSLCLLIIFVILRILQVRPHKQGEIFFSYLILYSLKRFIIEFYRGDNRVIFLGLTLFQLIAIMVFFFSLIKYARVHRKRLI